MKFDSYEQKKVKFKITPSTDHCNMLFGIDSSTPHIGMNAAYRCIEQEKIKSKIKYFLQKTKFKHR